MPFDTRLILDPAEDSPLAACESSMDTGVHSKTSWRRIDEDCDVPRLFAKTRGFSSASASISLGLRLVEG
jgi:hypothetical protein